MKRAIIKGKEDNVAVLLEDAKKGELVSIYSPEQKLVLETKAKTDVPYGNKIAITMINKRDQILKGDYKIGSAVKDISVGELVHVHNVKSNTINFPSSIIDEILKQMNIDGI